MLLIQQISNDPLQKQTIVLDDGTTFEITLYFRPLQLGWFIEKLVYKDFVLTGVRVCNLPNILKQFKSQIPFGIACFSTGDREPSQLEDFSSGNSNLYVLTTDEVLDYEAFLSE